MRLLLKFVYPLLLLCACGTGYFGRCTAQPLADVRLTDSQEFRVGASYLYKGTTTVNDTIFHLMRGAPSSTLLRPEYMIVRHHEVSDEVAQRRIDLAPGDLRGYVRSKPHMLAGKLYVFSEARNNKAKQWDQYYRAYDPVTLKPSTALKRLSQVPYKIGSNHHVRIATGSDRQHLVRIRVFNPKSGEAPTIHYQLFGAGMTPVVDTVLTCPEQYANGAYPENLYVDDQLNAHLMLRANLVKTKEWKKSPRQRSVLTISKEGAKTQTVAYDFGNDQGDERISVYKPGQNLLYLATATTGGRDDRVAVGYKLKVLNLSDGTTVRDDVISFSDRAANGSAARGRGDRATFEYLRVTDLLVDSLGYAYIMGHQQRYPEFPEEYPGVPEENTIKNIVIAQVGPSGETQYVRTLAYGRTIKGQIPFHYRPYTPMAIDGHLYVLLVDRKATVDEFDEIKPATAFSEWVYRVVHVDGNGEPRDILLDAPADRKSSFGAPVLTNATHRTFTARFTSYRNNQDSVFKRFTLTRE